MESILKIRNVLTSSKKNTPIKIEEFLEKSIQLVDVVEMTVCVRNAEAMLIYNIDYLDGIVIQEVEMYEFQGWKQQLKIAQYIDETDKENSDFARVYGYYDSESLEGFIRFVRKNKVLSKVEEIKCQIIYDQFRILLLEKEQNNIENKLKQVQYSDLLTGIKNRLALIEDITDKFSDNSPFSLIRIKLENLRRFNDVFGLTVTDEILKHFANRLKNIRSSHAFRTDGAEFVLLVLDPKDEKYMIETVRSSLTEPIKHEQHLLKLDGYIGLIRYPEHCQTLEELEYKSILSIEHSKLQGKNCIGYYKPELKKYKEEMKKLENDLKNAIASDNIDVHYQAQISLRDNKISGLEALARWENKGQQISPAKFITIAESTGMILDLGYSVFKKACFFHKKLVEMGYGYITIAVNVSIRQLMDEGFVERVKQIITEVGASTRFIEIEITESMTINTKEGISHKIAELKKLGFKIVMDDFGTGYASMEYLQSDIFSKIKIDRSFVKNTDKLDSDIEKNKMLLLSMVNLIKNIGMYVVVEGVETAEQLEFLKELDCHYVQGFIFSRPVNGEEMLKFITTREEIK